MEHILQLVGRFHPLVVHLPIGILLLAIGIEFLARQKKYSNLAPALPVAWGAGFITAVFSCIVGYFLKLDGGYEGTTIYLHQYLGIALAFTSGVIFVSKAYGKFEKLQLPIAGLSAFLLFGTGHLGGTLTHGEEYLTEPVVALLGKEKRPLITDINKAVVYHDLVVPVLEQKCYQCHNGSKQKGKLRLDTPEYLLKGGESGPALVAGKASESEVYKVLLLPEHDEKHMPPREKTQLTEEEISLIEWWISQAEADFNKTVAEVPKKEETSAFLAYFTAGGAEARTEAEKGESNSTVAIPSVEVAKAKPEDVEALQKLGVALTPLTPERTFMAANMVNIAHITDEHINALLKLEDQIIWLDFSHTDITDQQLQQIGKFKNLTRLSLDNTPVTDNGLAQLKDLQNLLYLNLYGTIISDKSIKSIEAYKNLKSLFLWRTKVTPQGIASLKQALGDEIKINYGSEIDTI